MENVIGILGAAIILFGFIMNQSRRWDNRDRKYDVANFVGASLLLFYAWQIGSYPFIAINLVWAVISLKDVLKRGNK